MMSFRHRLRPVSEISLKGFSLLEIVVTIALIGMLASIALIVVSRARTGVTDTKLRTDVTRLNQIISQYLADGGSLSGVSTPQAIIDKLKTVRADTDAKRQVGALTGRGVDVRLTAQMQTTATAATTTPRAVWNGTTQRFEISTTAGTAGVADFVLNDSLLATTYPTETRTRTTMLYNDTNGWVWTSGTYSPAAFLSPVNATLALQENVFDPTVAPPVVTLPAPVISPTGGSFTSSTFPSSITINSNGAPGGGNSQLQYMITHSNGTSTAWTAYSAAVSIAAGDTVKAKNVSTNTNSYSDSAITTQTYVLVTTTLPTPVITPGGGTFTSSTLPTSITISSNGAPGGSNSQLQYQIVHANGTSTAWTAYTGAVTIANGDTVKTKNVSTNTSTYSDSSTATQTYVISAPALPTPVITPAGGTFSASTLPTSVTISANGAPGGSSSQLQYMITHSNGTSTSWAACTGAVAIVSGDTVYAKNVTLNITAYSNSATTSQTYVTATATTLPKPVNNPAGGTFSAGSWPASITISSNGAPGTGSQLKYRINGGTWTNYTGAITIASGDKVESRNFATDTVLYADSSIDSDTYYKLVPSFAGSLVPTWTSISGGPNLQYTASNSNPDSVTLSHGDTRLDLGGGQYLDAGVANTLTFNRVASFANVSPNTDFNLGDFVILNGTTFNDSEATAATLSIALTITQPGSQTGTVPLNFTLVSTPNTSDRLASADTVTLNNPTTSFTYTSGGVTYTLQVRFVSADTDNGTVSGNTFYVYEGASARATLVGKWVSNK